MTNLDEIAAACDRLELSTHDPKWSSRVLEQLFETVLVDHQGTMTDLLQGFDLALRRNGVGLTESVANLIKDVVVIGFTRHKSSYDQTEWGWANHELTGEINAAQAYLFLHALPSDKATPASLLSILLGLEGTSQFEEAVDTLSENFERPAVRQELQRWRANGMETRVADILDAALQKC